MSEQLSVPSPEELLASITTFMDRTARYTNAQQRLFDLWAPLTDQTEALKASLDAQLETAIFVNSELLNDSLEKFGLFRTLHVQHPRDEEIAQVKFINFSVKEKCWVAGIGQDNKGEEVTWPLLTSGQLLLSTPDAGTGQRQVWTSGHPLGAMGIYLTNGRNLVDRISLNV